MVARIFPAFGIIMDCPKVRLAAKTSLSQSQNRRVAAEDIAAEK